jgi:hypothetical protein
MMTSSVNFPVMKRKIGKFVPMLNLRSTTPRRHMGSGCIDPHLLTSALAGGEWSESRPGRYTSRGRVPGTDWIGGWVGPRTGLDHVCISQYQFQAKAVKSFRTRRIVDKRTKSHYVIVLCSLYRRVLWRRQNTNENGVRWRVQRREETQFSLLYRFVGGLLSSYAG